MQRRKFILFGSALLASGVYASSSQAKACKTVVSSWYLPKFLENTKNNLTIKVRDTDSALGRYNKEDNIKEIKLEDVVKFHGHMCDGLVFAFLQISVALEKLFPDGIVDRTDLVGVAKNSPCLVDTLSYLTGAKINFKTLKIDSSVGGSHIVQRISTKEAYKVGLLPNIFPPELQKLESKIKSNVSKNIDVNPEDIDKVEELANNFIEKLLNTPLDKLIKVEKLNGYEFTANSDVSNFGNRGDVINKHVPRK